MDRREGWNSSVDIKLLFENYFDIFHICDHQGTTWPLKYFICQSVHFWSDVLLPSYPQNKAVYNQIICIVQREFFSFHTRKLQKNTPFCYGHPKFTFTDWEGWIYLHKKAQFLFLCKYASILPKFLFLPKMSLHEWLLDIKGRDQGCQGSPRASRRWNGNEWKLSIVTCNFQTWKNVFPSMAAKARFEYPILCSPRGGLCLINLVWPLKAVFKIIMVFIRSNNYKRFFSLSAT